jgi:feruloyl esterase
MKEYLYRYWEGTISSRSFSGLFVVGVCAAGMVACGDLTDETLVDRSLPKVAAHQTLIGSCADLAMSLGGLASTEIASVSEIVSGTLSVGRDGTPRHCLIAGKMHERTSAIDGNKYAIGFEMRLPISWNGRFFHQGNGGIDGRVATAIGIAGPESPTNALHQGFAVLSSDAGHDGSTGPLFGIDPDARLDYGYAAVQSLTQMAKELIATAYGKGPDYSYFGGCSNGGRHTFNAFTRLPDEYDGYLAGAPGFRLPYAAIANIFGAQQYSKVATDPDDLSTAFNTDERATVVAAVLDRCDRLDGIADGQVYDVESCQTTFSLDDVRTCSGARDGTCLSASQKSALAPIFSGAVTDANTEFYAPFPFDTGLASASYARWEFDVPTTRDSGAVGFIWGVPPKDPLTFDGVEFALHGSIDDMVASINATDDTYVESAVSFMSPPNPYELSAVQDRGAKIMVYHGVSDPIFSPLDTVDWYNRLAENHQGDATDFVRLYLVPGMGHCSGGPAVDQFDLLTPLVRWVEEGSPPSGIVATARGDGNASGANDELPVDWNADRTRPLCQYPLVARYDGSGDIELAASFSCEP